MIVEREAVLHRLSVSRETTARLDVYVEVLSRWSRRMNLVGRATLADVWRRHIEDSAQLLALAPTDARRWLDLGSGAGLPGLVIAALAADQRPSLKVALVDSDSRKAAFLQTAAREMGLAPEIIACRIEMLDTPKADVVSARALAPLPKLLDYVTPHLAAGGVCLLPKGATFASELTEAAQHWHSRTQIVRSVTDPSAVILVIQEPTRGIESGC